ncbi:unnamed protein product, partial [Rotaria socialis]
MEREQKEEEGESSKRAINIGTTVKANVFEYLPLTALRNNYKDTYNISISRFPGHPPIPSIYYM